MEVSPGRLNALKVALGVGILVGLFWGIGNLFFTESMHRATAPAGEEFTNSVEVQGKLVGAFALTWAVAAGMALRDIPRNLGLIRAIAIAVGILGVVGFYLDIRIAASPAAISWITDAVLIVLFVAVSVLIPGERAAAPGGRRRVSPRR